MWRRWKAGESLQEIGRALGKDHVVIHFLLARHGGIAPSARRRALRTLTLAEREDISPPVRFFRFGDIVVMIAQANPYSGKPARIRRIWVNLDGM
jgi:hypothetical protein